MSCPTKPFKTTLIKPKHTQKGCVHWFDLEGNANPKISSQKARPYIIVNSSSYSKSRIIISPITDRKHCVEKDTDMLKYPCNAPLFKKDYPFLDKDSAVLVDQVYTIGKDELCEEWYMGEVTDLRELDLAIMYNYDLFDTSMGLYMEMMKQAETIYTSSFSRK